MIRTVTWWDASVPLFTLCGAERGCGRGRDRLSHVRVSSFRGRARPRRAQIVNRDLHKAYAELKAILQNELAAVRGRRKGPTVPSSALAAVAVAAAAVGLFYYSRR